MSRTNLIAAFAVMMTTTMAIAHAQTAATAAPTPMPSENSTRVASPGGTPISANHLLPGQLRATEMNGAAVYDRDNQNLGEIKDIILDRDGRVAAVILNVGAILGVGGKSVAVAMNDLTVTNDNNKPRFTVAMTKDQLKAAQAFDLNEKNAPTGTSTPPPADRSR